MSAFGTTNDSNFLNPFGNTSIFSPSSNGGFGYSAPTNLPPVAPPSLTTPSPTATSQPQPAAQPATPTAPTSPWASFSPTFQQNGWNPAQYATDSTSQQLANILGGTSVKQSMGAINPFGVPDSNAVDLGGQDLMNSGLLAQRYASTLMPQWQKDAMTQAELSRMGQFSPTPSSDPSRINNPVAPIAQQAFAAVAKDPLTAAQAATPAPGPLAPGTTAASAPQNQAPSTPTSSTSQTQNTNSNDLSSQLQSMLSLLSLLGGFQGSSLQAAQSLAPSTKSTTPYGYTQWNQSIKPAGSYSGYQGAYNGSQTPTGTTTSDNSGLQQLLQLLTGSSYHGQGSGALF